MPELLAMGPCPHAVDKSVCLGTHKNNCHAFLFILGGTHAANLGSLVLPASLHMCIHRLYVCRYHVNMYLHVYVSLCLMCLSVHVSL